jgi:cytidine kinase
MPLIVTGTISIDTLVTTDAHREQVLGGSATYFAAAASFFTPVRLVAAVGDDFPPAYLATLQSFKPIDTRGLEQRKGSKSFRWGGKYHKNMNSRETMFTDLGIMAEQPPTIPEAFRDSRFVFLANTHPALQMGMIDQLPHRAITVADTMDLWINTARDALLVLLRRVGGLVLNYDEAELLTGRTNAVTAGRAILEMGPKFVIIKKGEHGALLVHREGMCALPAFPAETVIDPTGAGDSFAGGLMGWLASQPNAYSGPSGVPTLDTLRRAMAFGTVTASFTIEAFGPDRLTTLTRAEIDKRYNEYAAMVRL